MGLTTIGGLPAHPLLVHFVVVLVPLSAVLVLCSVLWPSARRRLGISPPAIALVTLVLVPITTDAGEWLEHNSPHSELIEIHAELGDQLLIWSIAVFVFAATWWVLHTNRFTEWRNTRTSLSDSSTSDSSTLLRVVTIAIAAMAVVAAVGSMVQVYRIGESGAKAVWQEQS